MDVGGWLRGLGLGQYEEKFRDNKIDADVLPRLTVDDLKDIGVSVVGDRRRLLDAITVIAGAGRPADVPASPTKSAPSKGLQASAERRPITVMFCDLVGSTSLAAKLDAEDWRNLVNAYLDEASAAVTGLGGHVLEEARRRVDGAVRLSARAGERRRARRARRASDPARAGRTQRQERQQQARRSSRRASGSIPGRSSSTPPARCSATRPTSRRGCRPRPSRVPSSSPPPYSGRPPGCSSPRTAARTNSRACRNRCRFIASFARAAAADGAARGR